MEKLPTPEEIQTAAESASLSIAALCRQSGVDDSTFWRWKNGKHSPKMSIVARWLNVIANATSIND